MVKIITIMSYRNKIENIIQFTAQYAVSGLCFLHPHLGEQCHNAGVETININLLGPGFDPKLTNITNELKLSADALRNKFKENLAVESVSVAAIRFAFIEFSFLDDQFPATCHIETVTTTGEKIEFKLNLSAKSDSELN